MSRELIGLSLRNKASGSTVHAELFTLRPRRASSRLFHRQSNKSGRNAAASGVCVGSKGNRLKLSSTNLALTLIRDTVSLSKVHQDRSTLSSRKCFAGSREKRSRTKASVTSPVPSTSALNNEHGSDNEKVFFGECLLFHCKCAMCSIL